MKNPQGRIVTIDNRDAPGLAVVEVATAIACQRCASGKGCGAGLLGAGPHSRHVEASLSDGVIVRTGDSVSIALQPKNLLQAAIVVYGYPLAGALLAVIVAFGMALGDSLAAVYALAGTGLGLFLARRRLRSAYCLRHFRPVVVENLSATLS